MFSSHKLLFDEIERHLQKRGLCLARNRLYLCSLCHVYSTYVLKHRENKLKLGSLSSWGFFFS